jgi:ABC-type Mn2+/Zn2+ transport system permease subunit
MAAPEPSGLLASLAVAAAAGLIGVFAVMRRMTLASDAFSHVALPGVAVALLWRVNPVVGGLAALLAGAVVVWLAENRTTVPTEAIIGVLFSAALAAGSMLASGEELIEALFGGNRVADRGEAALAGVGAGVRDRLSRLCA